MGQSRSFGTLDANSTAGRIADTLTCSKASGTGLSVTNNATIGGTLVVTGSISSLDDIAYSSDQRQIKI